MAKKKQYRPINLAVAIICAVLALALMAGFIYYIVASPSADEDNISIEPVSVDGSSEEEVSFGEHKETMAEAEVGDLVSFGKFPKPVSDESSDESDGSEEEKEENIVWIVLAKDEGSVFLVTRDVIDCKKFSSGRNSASYDDSDIKKWLCDDFINGYFTETESDSVIETENGKAFLLSAEEAENYFASNAYRVAKPNGIAVKNGVRVENGRSFWWLRDSGKNNMVKYVDIRGELRDGFAPDYNIVGVRVGMYVSLDAEKEE